MFAKKSFLLTVELAWQHAQRALEHSGSGPQNLLYGAGFTALDPTNSKFSVGTLLPPGTTAGQHRSEARDLPKPRFVFLSIPSMLYLQQARGVLTVYPDTELHSLIPMPSCAFRPAAVSSKRHTP